MVHTGPAVDPWVLIEPAFRVETNRHVEGLMALGGFGVKSREEVETAVAQFGLSFTPAPVEKDKKKKGRDKQGSPEGDIA